MKKSVLAIFALCAASTIFFSCKKTDSKNSKISVVTTTFPCYDAVRAVCGDYFQKEIGVKMLVKPGLEVHSFDPSPADIISVQKSDLFVYVGGESDEWVETLLESSENELKCRALTLIHFVNTLDEPEFEDDIEDFYEDEHDEHHHEEHEHAHEAEHHHEHEENAHEQDEHIWTSPENELIIVRAVCTYLSEIAEEKGFSEMKAIFEENADKYCAEISRVAEKTQEIIDGKSEKILLLADRFPFIYFTTYYGLEHDAAFSGCSTAVEASTATISRLIDTVKEKNLPAIFYIELGNHKIASTIAESTKTDALLLESLQNVTKTNFENGETWVTLMEKNAETLKKGLK